MDLTEDDLKEMAKLGCPNIIKSQAEGTLELIVEQIGKEEASKRTDEDMFFLVDVSFTIRKFSRWKALFPRVQPFFAVKCNPNPYIVCALSRIDECGFDCASIAELRLVRSYGVSASRIVFANPCKTPEALEFTLAKEGICKMTFDSPEELHKISRELERIRNQYPDKDIPEPELVLRLRVPDSDSNVPLGEKYGANLENCDELIEKALKLDLRLIGISFHCGSGCHSTESYIKAIRLAKHVFDMAAAKGVLLTLLDIGGGYPGYDGSEGGLFAASDSSCANGETTVPLNCQDIAAEIVPLIDELFPDQDRIKVISEPGRYFVEGSHCLLTQICDRRWVDANDVPTTPPDMDSSSSSQHSFSAAKRVAYMVGEGVLGCFKDAMLCGETFNPHPLRVHGNDAASTDGRHYDSMLMGPSGEAFDCIARNVKLPLLEVGDWLYFTRTGAYSASIASANSSIYVSSQAYAYVATRIGGEEGRI